MTTQQTITTTLPARSIEHARTLLEERFDTGIVIQLRDSALAEWAAKRALAWGRIVADDPDHGLSAWAIEITEVIRPSDRVLTEDKITAQHALDMRSTGSVSGEVTAEWPWGGQCTGLLADGTPVDRLSFPRDVLAVLAGRKTAAEVVATWRDHVRKVL